MNTEAQNKAHECAERAAHWNHTWTKHMWIEILAAVILIPLGLITMPFGAFFLLLGGGSITMAFVSHTLAKQALKEFFELRETFLKEGQYNEYD